MCGIAKQTNPLNSLLGHSTFRKLDPLMGNLEDLDTKLFPGPKLPEPPPPPQEVKSPDAPVRRRQRTTNPTLLTGPTGLDSALLNTGGATLLGGGNG